MSVFKFIRTDKPQYDLKSKYERMIASYCRSRMWLYGLLQGAMTIALCLVKSEYTVGREAASAHHDVYSNQECSP